MSSLMTSNNITTVNIDDQGSGIGDESPQQDDVIATPSEPPSRGAIATRDSKIQSCLCCYCNQFRKRAMSDHGVNGQPESATTDDSQSNKTQSLPPTSNYVRAKYPRWESILSTPDSPTLYTPTTRYEQDVATFGCKNVIVILDEQISNNSFSALKQKMRGVTCKPFSLDFVHVATIGKTKSAGKSNDQLYCPCDIKISYKCHSLLISDLGNSRIQVFDLATLKYRTSIPIAAKQLCIEPDYDSAKSDALIVTCNDHCVYKYDLEQLIEQSKRGQVGNFIWRSGTPNQKGKSIDQFNQPSGMTWSNNLLFVCDTNNNRVKVLSLADGKSKGCIGDLATNNADTARAKHNAIRFKGPWDIQTNENSELVVCEVDTHKIQVISNHENSWILKKSFGKGYSSTFNHPRGVIVDKSREHIILADQDNHRVVVLHEKTGQVIKTFGSRGFAEGQLFKPHGICLNERTGEILVADYLNHRVEIFK